MPLRSSPSRWLVLLALGILSLPIGALANPPGRAWTPVARQQMSPMFLRAPRIDTDPNGDPVLFASVYGTGPSDGSRFTWQDSGFVPSWFFGSSILYLWPVVSPPGDPVLIWMTQSGGIDDHQWIMFAHAGQQSISPPESVF